MDSINVCSACGCSVSPCEDCGVDTCDNCLHEKCECPKK